MCIFLPLHSLMHINIWPWNAGSGLTCGTYTNSARYYFHLCCMHHGIKARKHSYIKQLHYFTRWNQHRECTGPAADTPYEVLQLCIAVCFCYKQFIMQMIQWMTLTWITELDLSTEWFIWCILFASNIISKVIALGLSVDINVLPISERQ